jgi:GNAT superfamily N-acetyltransferase
MTEPIGANDVQIRPARSWDEVRRTAVTAGQAFDDRRPAGPFFHARIVDAPGLPLENTLLLTVDGTLAGGLQIYERQVTVGTGTVTAGAIANVHVLPEFRGQGLSKRLLAGTNAFLEDRGYALSILGAAIHDLYADAGWTSLPHEETLLEAPTTVDGGASERLRPYRHDADLPAVVRCYRSDHAGVTGRFRRPEWLWRGWMLDPETKVLDPDQLRVYEEDGAVTGYAVLDGAGESCIETAYAGDDRETFQRTCWNAVAADADSVEWHPALPPAVEAAVGTGETSLDDHMMVRGYDWETLSAVSGTEVRDTDALVEVVTDGEWYWSDVDAF